MGDTVKKYFYQKSWTVFEILCIMAAAFSLYITVYVWGGGQIGFAFLSMSVGALAISKTTKITEVDVEDVLRILLRDNRIKIDEKSTIATYELKKQPIKKGKDGVFRSREYVISCFDFGENIKISVYRIDLFELNFNYEEHYVLPNEQCSLISEKLETQSGFKDAYWLKKSDMSFCIPVVTNDIDAWNIIERVCKQVVE